MLYVLFVLISCKRYNNIIVYTGGQGQPIQLVDTIRRQEVDAVLKNQNILISTVQEIRSFIGDVNSKTDNILNNQARNPTAQVIIYIFINLYKYKHIHTHSL